MWIGTGNVTFIIKNKKDYIVHCNRFVSVLWLNVLWLSFIDPLLACDNNSQHL